MQFPGASAYISYRRGYKHGMVDTLQGQPSPATEKEEDEHLIDNIAGSMKRQLHEPSERRGSRLPA
jgi:hypothetical protein